MDVIHSKSCTAISSAADESSGTAPEDPLYRWAPALLSSPTLSPVPVTEGEGHLSAAVKLDAGPRVLQFSGTGNIF